LPSFNNTSPEDAIQAIGAALRGEAEPIRRYGILLNDATLKNEALALGLIKTTKEALSPANKVLAAQAAIYKQTSDAQGDFGKTSDGLANSQRILAANIEDVKITLGESLLPIALKFSNFLKTNLVPAIKGLVDGLTGQTKKAVVPSLGMFQEKTEDAENAGYDLGAALRNLGGGLKELSGAFASETSNESEFVRFINLLTRMVEGLDRLFERLDKAQQKFRDFKTAFDNSLIGQFAGATGTFAPENAPVNTLRQSTGITGSRTPTVIVNNNIKTAVDPQATARAITKVTNSAFKTTGISFIRPQFR
jgi:hypothetical protein